MGFLRHSLIALLLVGMIFGVHGQKCGLYHQDGGICANYKSNDDYVIYNEGKDLEKALSSLASAQGLSTLRTDDSFLKNCTQAFTSFVCATEFPKCSNTDNSQVGVVPPCLSTCENAIKLCNNSLESAPEDTQEIIKGTILSSPFFPPDCAGDISTLPPLNVRYPTENCNISPQLTDNPKCLSPLVEDKKWINNNSDVTDPRFCQRGCCLPCPQSYALYPSNQLERGFLATQIFRAFSAIGSGIMLTLYLILPGKRTHPSTLILYTSLSIFMYSFNVFFSIFKPKTVQCLSDGIVPSTQDNNPFFCGVQGASLIFASHATAIWVGFIILNLHIHTVWNSNILKDKYLYLNMIGWGVPGILTIVSLATKSISYQFATLCFVKVDSSDGIFFYPLAVVIIPSFFIHMSTFVYIYRISKKDKEEPKESESIKNRRLHVLQAIKIQWRALLLAIILIVTILFYWLFYFIELSKLAGGPGNNNFITEWTVCIQSGNGQDYCAKHVSSRYMPSFGLLLSAEITTSLIGIYLIIIFFNEALWQECKQWINAKYNPREMEFLAI